MPSDALPPDVRRLLDERSRHARRGTGPAPMSCVAGSPISAGTSRTARPGRPPARGCLAALTGYADAVTASRLDGGDRGRGRSRSRPRIIPATWRALRGLAAHPSAAWELVVVANAPSFTIEEVLAAVADLPVVLRRGGGSPRCGRCRNARHARRSSGEMTVLLDTSLELTGDVIGPLLGAFDDPSVGVAGGWGVTSGDARQFDDAPPGEVDAIEAYCLAVRREAPCCRRVRPPLPLLPQRGPRLQLRGQRRGWRAVRTDRCRSSATSTVVGRRSPRPSATA